MGSIGRISTAVGHPRRDSSSVIELFFTPVVETSLRVHQKFDASIAKDTSADWRVIVTAASANVVLRFHKELRHCFRAQVSGHHKVLHHVTTKVRTLPRAISLMPVGGNEDPAVLSNLWEEGFVG